VLFNRSACRVFVSACALTALAGCSGIATSSTSTPQTALASRARASNTSVDSNVEPTSVLRPDVTYVRAHDPSGGFADPDAASKAAVIVADSGSDNVYVFTTKGKLTATITGLDEPQGVALDAAGNLYVANTLGNDVIVYKNDFKTVLATLADPGQYPAGVGVDRATGLVGVTNIVSTGGGTGSVSFYEPGATQPCNTLTSARFAKVYNGAFGEAGHFYIDGLEHGGKKTAVGVIEGGCSAKLIKTLRTANTIAFPGDVKVSPSNQIAIGDQGNQAIYTYDLPKNGSLGKPIATTPLTYASDPVSFAFTKSGDAVYVADTTLPRGEVQKYRYPRGDSTLETFYAGKTPIGIVVTPLESP
jgi:DNA-binding beta-propeller fold protein YncE